MKFVYRLYCLVQLQIPVSRMILWIWPTTCILVTMTVLAFVWLMMSLFRTWYSPGTSHSIFISMNLPLPFATDQENLLFCLVDICGCWFHSSPIYFWALWTDPAYCYEIWFNSCCSKNWRWVPIFLLRSQNFSTYSSFFFFKKRRKMNSNELFFKYKKNFLFKLVLDPLLRCVCWPPGCHCTYKKERKTLMVLYIIITSNEDEGFG